MAKGYRLVDGIHRDRDWVYRCSMQLDPAVYEQKQTDAVAKKQQEKEAWENTSTTSKAKICIGCILFGISCVFPPLFILLGGWLIYEFIKWLRNITGKVKEEQAPKKKNKKKPS
ncbi:hypothetical protein [Candidatus Nanosyncoccus alces]|nr:hypothetical protein [Candidatus Nanosyncoccus alces]